MLKYNDMIAELSDDQKIRILSGVGKISGKDMKNRGIPCIKVGNMKDFDRDLYPHTTSISHSWNTSLWSEVAAAKVNKMSKDGVDLFVAHGPKVKLSPYRKETTEDPYFSSVISAAYMKEAAARGMMTGASGYYVSESDVNWLDESPNERVLNQFVVAPYKKALEISGAQVLVTDSRKLNDKYKDTSTYIQNAIADSTEFLVCEHATEDNTVDLVSRGIICLDGSANALKTALVRHRKLQRLLSEGKDITLEDIEEEISSRKAISDEMLDASLDRALDFIFKCTKERDAVEDVDIDESALALRATLESTVLLKNEGDILPIKKVKSMAIVDCVSEGCNEADTLGAQIEEILKAKGIDIKRVRGISSAECNDDSVFSINNMCQDADMTLLLLGSGYDAERIIYKTEKLTLPPEQLYLSDKISKVTNKVVAVVLSEHAADMEFARPFSGLILTPLRIKYTASAITQIVTGESEAMGRLAYTLYSGSETALRKGYAYRHQHGMKAGAFIGYRYYDTADMCVGYPFGHGLSYAKFEYAQLSVSEKEVSFTIQNIGTRRGCEVAQIYAGFDSPSILRPKKELLGFAKIELEPFEKKKITVTIELPTVFVNGTNVHEKGEYTVYVGASVSDVRLEGKIQFGDTSLLSDGEQLSDYLQTKTNVLKDKYTLEADYSIMKNKEQFKNILVGVGSITLAIVLAVFNITMQLNSMALGIISGILAFFAVIFFIIDAIERTKARSNQIAEIDEANKELFKDAEQIPVLSTQKMFEENFDTPAEEHKETEVFYNPQANSGAVENVNDDFRILNAVREFNQFASERGYKMSRGVTENLFASLTSSRLLLVNGLNSEQFNSFILLISEYFEAVACMDNSSKNEDGSEEKQQNVFYEYDHEGYKVKKNIFKAFSNAVNTPSTVQIAAIDEITAENVNDWLAPLMKYLVSPKKSNDISISDDGKISRYTISRNLWIALRLADDQTIDSLPIEMIRCASVVNISFTPCQPSDDHMTTHGFNAHQADYMLEKESGKGEVSEDVWKKIDRLEKYATDYSGYRIGNKLWLEFEKHIGMLLACEMDISDAVDAALATRILPSITVELKDKLGKEDKTVYQMVEFIFGADNVAFSKAFAESLKSKDSSSEE